eukprot:TRINITY_DN1032_c0_g3_i1.p1 TRINITY_DN1032_c0_g3~~TRINITY_DN1032_c0_g3_i1.p1  ORF type:complete len:298 (+),score=84.87 TRINITY_DN1032_c0_g3_i1:107-1000(+)
MTSTTATAHVDEVDHLTYVVSKRKRNFAYIKRVLQGKTHWLNVFRLNKGVVMRFYPAEKLQRRLSYWFMIGLSCAPLLEMTDNSFVVRACAQLFEEIDHYLRTESYYTPSSSSSSSSSTTISASSLPPSSLSSSTPTSSPPVSSSISSTFQGIKSLFGKDVHPASSLSLQSNHRPPSRIVQSRLLLKDSVSASLLRIGKHVVYEFLQLPPASIVGALDYFEVTYSVCDVLYQLYSKFLDKSCQESHLREAIVAFDEKIMEFVLLRLSKELTQISNVLVKAQVTAVYHSLFNDLPADT